MKLKKIEIHNFRAFKDVVIDFNDFNCIIGKNDAGKSTIFAALEWFFDSYRELNENDFAAAGFDYVEDEYTKEYIYDNFYISVDVYFDNVTIPSSSEQNEFIFDKDFLSTDGDICIRKYMYHPFIDIYCPYPTNEKSTGYRIKKHIFKSIGKPFSDCSIEELKNAYIKIGKNPDELCKTLVELREEQQKTKKRGIQFSVYSKNIIKEEIKIKKMICTDLYNYYSIKEKDERKWDDNDNKYSSIEEIETYFEFILPKYILYTSKTPITDYLNLLLTPYNARKVYDPVEEAKKHTAEKLSQILKYDGENESIDITRNEKIDLFTPESLVFKHKDLPLAIPLSNRGEGLQLKIKNAVFRLLTEIQIGNQVNIIFAFEEPETHLHPSAQIEMFKTIKALSENSNYQVIITTHSPYIVKELANDNIYPIVVKRNEKNNESIITSLNNERVLPYSSMNELNYVAFDYASEEFHQELYGKIEIDWFGVSNGCKIDDIINSLNKCDFKPSNRQIKFKDILSKIIKQFNHDSIPDLDLLKNEFISPDKDPQDHTLCHCVRNAIDHPCEENYKWKHNQIVELSIKILLEINNFLVDIEKQFKNIVEKRTENLDDFGKKIDYYVNEEKQSHSIVFWTYHCHYKDLKVKITKKDKTPVKKTMKDVKKALEIMGKQLST